MLERVIFLTDNFPAIEVGGCLVMIEPAAFNEHDTAA